nr:MAG TPA: hypothetical protein [Caudoviricetes sp.]
MRDIVSFSNLSFYFDKLIITHYWIMSSTLFKICQLLYKFVNYV